MQPMEKPASAPGPQGHKKALLQKLMDNLLSKPGRSMHEIINGVKSAIGAYKNYSKEWDTLSSAGGSHLPAGGSSTGIQSILKEVQTKKDGSGGPRNMPQGNPNGMPVQSQGNPALGNPQAVPPSPQPTPPPQVQSQGSVNPPSTGIPPMGQMPTIPPIAGQPQTSTFNRPAPVNSLGIWGH